ncbi:MAG: formate/nitrite transporter family protein [Verrucomicrobiota bacterium]|nr:formate/nitrite transporter family protein [Verrucomicrobiota bacterium]
MARSDNVREAKQSGDEEQLVEEMSTTKGRVVYKAVQKEGEDELERTNSALAWSGLAAGLSMGFSLMTEGLLHSHLPDAPWRLLVSKFGYSIGFLVVILGRQQLFTENTLTVILPLLRKHDARTCGNVARLWTIVLLANLVGGFIVAWLLGHTNGVGPEVHESMKKISLLAMDHDFGTLLIRGVFAGWLIALMVWLLPVADTARVGVIIIITYVVGIGEFSHIVAGSVEAFYLVGTGVKSIGDYFVYMVPILIGNIIGGSSIVAAIAHAEYIGSGEGENHEDK